ncbi:MAG: antibiotic biosynthesis monooxygenase [Gordonia sp. (in: high G+C Gram-positive bacteria)]|nr:MAG: antibiotic biosynthesis monooxygenase [Gordonia sp. (in: high G+C Gram-positive bacteria)]
MSVVKINAITVPEGAGPELEKRFAARKHAVDSEPGFEGFQLLRPTAGKDRYFVVTTWATEEDFQQWKNGRMPAAHAAERDGRPAPVATGAELLEFEVVDLD